MQEQAKEIETLKNQVTSLAELNDFFGKVKATGENSATYYACMDIRCKAAAKIPIKVLQQGEHGTILRADHAVYRMLHDRPNQLCTAYDFKFATEFQRLEYGNAYWLPVYNLAGRLAQIQLLDSQKVTIQINSALEPWQPGYLLYYYSGPSGMRILTPDEILHFRNYSKDGIHGRSVRQQIMDVIQAEESGQNLLKSKYESGLIDPLIVEADVDLSDKKRKQAVIKKFSGVRGAEHAGEIIPIPPDFKVQQLSTKLVDSQFFEMQGLTTKRIANGFGVPGFMLNDLDGATYSNIQQQNARFYSDTMQSTFTQYEGEMDAKLFTASERRAGIFAQYNVDAMLRSDTKSRYDAYSVAISAGFMKISEVREKENLPFVEGTDQLLIGNGASVPLDQLGEQYTNGTPKGGEENGNQNQPDQDGVAG